MSTRWYPIYQKGNPQLRIFLPNFWLKLVTPELKQPKNVVQFHCSIEMTKYDVQNYLEKIYNVQVIDVRTRIALGKTKLDRLQGSVIKDDDVKVAYAILPKDQSFTYPELFKGRKPQKSIKEQSNELKKMHEQFTGPTIPGMSSWFRMH